MRLRMLPAALLGCAALAHAQESPEIVAEAAIRQTLAATDLHYQQLRSLLKHPAVVADLRKPGQSSAADLKAYLLTPKTVAKIEQLHAQVIAELTAGTLDAARGTMQALSATVENEVAVDKAISQYWNVVAGDPPNREAYLANLLKHGIQPRYADEIAAARKQFESQIRSAKFVEAMTRTYPTIQELWKKAAKEEDAAVRAALAAGKFKPLLEQQSTHPCTPTTKTSGKPTPQLVQIGTGHEDYYPADSKLLEEQGEVYALVRVSAEGCPQSALVTVTSGYRSLDVAALKLLFDGHYLPAEQDGHAVAASFPFKMNWTLK